MHRYENFFCKFECNLCLAISWLMSAWGSLVRRPFFCWLVALHLQERVVGSLHILRPCRLKGRNRTHLVHCEGSLKSLVIARTAGTRGTNYLFEWLLCTWRRGFLWGLFEVFGYRPNWRSRGDQLFAPAGTTLRAPSYSKATPLEV